MSIYDPVLPQPRSVTYALVPGDEEVAFIADSPEVLTRVVILRLVAQLRSDQASTAYIHRIRAALEAHDWEEAIVGWMDATGHRLNMFDDEKVWTDKALDEERLCLELPLSPIFDDPDGQ